MLAGGREKLSTFRACAMADKLRSAWHHTGSPRDFRRRFFCLFARFRRFQAGMQTRGGWEGVARWGWGGRGHRLCRRGSTRINRRPHTSRARLRATRAHQICSHLGGRTPSLVAGTGVRSSGGRRGGWKGAWANADARSAPRAKGGGGPDPLPPCQLIALFVGGA